MQHQELSIRSGPHTKHLLKDNIVIQSIAYNTTEVDVKRLVLKNLAEINSYTTKSLHIHLCACYFNPENRTD